MREGERKRWSWREERGVGERKRWREKEMDLISCTIYIDFSVYFERLRETERDDWRERERERERERREKEREEGQVRGLEREEESDGGREKIGGKI